MNIERVFLAKEHMKLIIQGVDLMALVPGGIIQICDEPEEIEIDPDAPYLAQLGWTISSLYTAMSLGQVLFSDLNGTIGFDGKIPWYNKVDLKRFKDLTMGGTLIMGRKTYDSLPIGGKSGKKLDGRLKYVISSKEHEDSEDTKWFQGAGVDLNPFVLRDVINTCPNDKPIWIIGGASIYKMAIECSVPDFIDHTILNTIYVGDTKLTMEQFHQRRIKLAPINYEYMVESEIQNEEDPILWHRRYIKRSSLNVNKWPSIFNQSCEF